MNRSHLFLIFFGVAREVLGLANGEAVTKGKSVEKSIVAARDSCCCDTV